MTNSIAIPKREFIKSFTIGFLPLLAYIVVEEVWGFSAGIAAALLLGAGELIYSYLQSKKIEYFVLLDVGLLGILAVISYLFHSDLMLKLKPAFINVVFLVLIYVTAFTPKPILIEMTMRRMKGINLDELQLTQMKALLRFFFYIILLHTLLIVYASFFLSKSMWGFITGGLFYILAGIVPLIMFARNKINAWRLNSRFKHDEWFPLVDAEGKIVGRAPRALVHGNPDLLHPVVHLHVFNSKGELFLQKRSEKKAIQPGKWDTAVGGHVMVNETIEQALLRETQEEIGVKPDRIIPIMRYVWRSDVETELVFVFKWVNDGPFILNPEEITEGKFWKKQKIDKKLNSGIFSPNFEYEFSLLKQANLI
ncbi:MAG: hypothetical protein Kow00108_00810 [Calditrichia bacterium]